MPSFHFIVHSIVFSVSYSSGKHNLLEASPKVKTNYEFNLFLYSE
jgi:hypothetical protein